jgi:hypothetical protein
MYKYNNEERNPLCSDKLELRLLCFQEKMVPKDVSVMYKYNNEERNRLCSDKHL